MSLLAPHQLVDLHHLSCLPLSPPALAQSGIFHRVKFPDNEMSTLNALNLEASELTLRLVVAALCLVSGGYHGYASDVFLPQHNPWLARWFNLEPVQFCPTDNVCGSFA